jgi:hypothetical protein
MNMKFNSISVLLSFVVLFIVNAYSQDFYDIDVINDIHINFEQDNWDSQLDQLAAARQEERLLGQVVVNGQVYDSVGVRYKGNSSYNSRQVKNPLNIKLDYVIDQKHDGAGTIKLSNVYKDPSFVRETLSYEIARNYMPASKANYARVYINDTFIGFYVSVQDVDKSFAKSHFGSKDNAFFKGELTNSSPNTSSTVWGYSGSGLTYYKNYYELESDEGWDELYNFLDVFNNDPSNIKSVLNVDRHLWMLAFDVLFVNLDSPINFGHNYYLYQDDGGRFNPIIWDLNENFGVFSRLLTGGQVNLPNLDLFLNSTSSTYPIVSNVLSNPTYKKMYVAHLKTIFQEIVASGWYVSRAKELQDKIAADVQADNNKFYSNSAFSSNVESTVSGGMGPGNSSFPGLKSLMDSRSTYLYQQSEFMAPSPEFSYVPTATFSESQAWITVEVSNVESVQLAYRGFGYSIFEKVDMFDDGNHQDGQANDGIYGAAIELPSPSMQYYIYAENGDAAAFSPVRAEYEFYTLSLTSDLVINEFMADNDSLHADADGEFDDWIELYNAGDADIALFGYFLSDDAEELTKWTFPEVTIATGDYLIVWADKDLGQSGLHADLKLSSNGEELYLVSPDTLIVDQVLFGAQATNTSFGRYPNGTGSFINMLKPTFALPNEDSLTQTQNTISAPIGFELKQNFPNPFNPMTTIRFSLPAASSVSLNIYNALGRLVATVVDEQLSAGTHEFLWQAANMSSGLYFYTLTSDSFSQTKRMILLK